MIPESFQEGLHMLSNTFEDHSLLLPIMTTMTAYEEEERGDNEEEAGELSIFRRCAAT